MQSLMLGCGWYDEQDKGAALKGKSILEVVQSATEAPVRNNGGGHYNHSYVTVGDLLAVEWEFELMDVSMCAGSSGRG